MELKLPSDYPVLMIFDNFSAQKTDAVLKRLRDNYIHTVYVPPNCTGYLQPMDISVNKSVKEFLRQQFQTWLLTESVSN